jgi:hypothetical protein
MAELDEERVELERQHRVAQGTELVALLFEDKGINAVEAPEVEAGLLPGLVGDTAVHRRGLLTKRVGPTNTPMRAGEESQYLNYEILD